MNIPKPYSALSSNNELAQAGPWPFTSIVLRNTPQIDEQPVLLPFEQPVAFAMYILSPNSCVTSFAYGVSPQPAQAPENSR